MAPYYFSFQEDWKFSHAAYWVHIPVGGDGGQFAPPAPLPIPHKGYPFLHAQFEASTLTFSSLAQLDHYIDVLATVPLPTTRRLSELRDGGMGPNSHWLSRLPGTLKSPKKRPALVETLKEARAFALASPYARAFSGQR